MNATRSELDFQPLKMHKNLVINVLRDHPEELPQIASGWKGTAEEYIAALEAHHGQWFVNGVLTSDPD